MTAWGLSMAGCEAVISAAIRVALEATRGPVTYLEIGVAGGATFAPVCRRLAASGRSWKAVGLDLPEGVEGFLLPGAWCLDERAFKEATAAFGERVALERAVSQEWLTRSREPIALALIDGCHEEACVRADFLALEPRIAEAGVVIFHDTAPWSQDIDPQPHRGEPIRTLAALQSLGLLAGRRPGWRFVAEAPGRQAEGGRGCIVFQKVS
ncbi:MAG TPA: class I SAM-dependent methyltransferase [Thermoanaerobaculia bacterium]|nr:class I SAM-dependent methyltransferase [Thermoanaerobaculia bacterium]